MRNGVVLRMQVQTLTIRNDGRIAIIAHFVGSTILVQNDIPVHPSRGPCIQISYDVVGISHGEVPIPIFDWRPTQPLLVISCLAADHAHGGKPTMDVCQGLELISSVPMECNA